MRRQGLKGDIDTEHLEITTSLEYPKRNFQGGSGYRLMELRERSGLKTQFCVCLFIAIDWYVCDYCGYLRKYIEMKRRETLDYALENFNNKRKRGSKEDTEWIAWCKRRSTKEKRPGSQGKIYHQSECCLDDK